MLEAMPLDEVGPTEPSAGSGRPEVLSEVLAKQATGGHPPKTERGWLVAR